jgi:hypothetical protein
MTRAISAADITDLTGLKNAASTGGSYTITPAMYVLDSVLDFNQDIMLTHDGTAGHVVIVADSNRYRVNVSDVSATFSGIDDDRRIQFTNGSNHSVLIQSTFSEVDVTFNYCDFTTATVNGLTMANSPAADMSVTCNKCRAYDNANDGFSMWTSTSSYYQKLALNDCDGFNNVGGQGATAHSAKQILLVNGGRWYENGSEGIIAVGDSVLYVTGATFYNNDQFPGGRDLATGNGAGSIAFIDSCKFTNAGNGYTETHIYAKGAYCEITNCEFYNPSDVSAAYVVRVYRGEFAIRSNVFRDHNHRGSYDILIEDTAGGGLIVNNTLYGGRVGIGLERQYVTVKNNIFHSLVAYGILTQGDGIDAYKLHASCGYNCFYNCGDNFYDAIGSTADQSHSTDIFLGPRLTDPANGDISLQSDSPCLNAGEPTLYGGLTDIGVWQGKSVVRNLPSNCTAPLEMDLNDDCRVDLRDLSLFAQSWLDCNLAPPSMCWE